MKKEIKSLGSSLTIYAVLLFAAQRLFVNEYFEIGYFYYPTFAIYIFHYFSTLLILIGLIAVKNIFFEKTGYAFMAFSLLKMMASILFLIPLIQSEKSNYIPDVLAFFIPYFFFLFFEIIFSIKLLNSKPDE